MKSLFAAGALALCLAFAPARAEGDDGLPPLPEPGTQEFLAQKFIYTLLAGDLDSLKVLFPDSIRPQLTAEVMEHLRGQFKWFWDLVGGEFELFMSGQQDSTFFREYRFANETNKRYPFYLIHMVFPDSVTPLILGAQVKNYLGGSEKPLGRDLVWKIGGHEYDIHSISVLELPSGGMVAVRFHDTDTARLTMEGVTGRGLPLVREVVARGYLDSAKTLMEGRPVTDDIGLVFIRREPASGLEHIRISFRPEDYNHEDHGGPVKVTGKPSDDAAGSPKPASKTGKQDKTGSGSSSSPAAGDPKPKKK